MNKKEIVICGSSNGWNAKTGNKEVWTYDLKVLMSRSVDKMFAMEKLKNTDEVLQGFYPKKEDGKVTKVPCTLKDVKEKLKDVEFISAYPYPDVPSYKEYPIKEILEKTPAPYFLHPVAYMIAYAIHNKITSIELWGVGSSSSMAYIFHKPCIEFWIGYAVGVGVSISVNGKTDLLRQKELFGYRMIPSQLKELKYA